MYNTLDEVKMNKYINRLDLVAKKFGLYGCYVDYKGAVTSSDDGIYFLLGYNEDYIQSVKINAGELYKKDKKDFHLASLTVVPYKLTDCEPFSIHQIITEGCRSLEFLKKLYEKYNIKMPSVINPIAIRDLKMYYANSMNPELPQRTRATYEKSLRNCLDMVDTEINPQKDKYEEKQYILKGYYDPNKSKLANWFKRKFSKHPNRVSLEQVFNESYSVGRIIIRYDNKDKIIKGLNEKPEILYWVSPMHGVIFDVPEGQGYGPEKRLNDGRTVALAFNRMYFQEVMQIVNRVSYPEACKITENQMREKYDRLCSVTIPYYEYRNFSNLCKCNNVEFCLSTRDQPERDDMVFFVPVNNMNMLDGILTRLGNETEEYHIVQNCESIMAKHKGCDDMPSLDFNKILGNDPLSKENVEEQLKKVFPESNFIVLDNKQFDNTEER